MELYKSEVVKERMQFGTTKLAELRAQKMRNVSQNSDIFFIIRAFSAVTIKIDLTSYDFIAGELIFIGPTQRVEILAPWSADGFLIWFTADFYERSKADTEIINSGLFFGNHSFISMQDTYRDDWTFKKLIVERLAGCAEDYMVDMMVAHHCIESLLLDGYQAMFTQERSKEKGGVVALQVFNQFSILLHKHYREHSSVQYYANRLHLSPRKLTELCFAIAGKSAKCVISDVVTRQALRYIKHTALSISQISYEMGFSDESNFRNFFKRQTGSNPLSYRQG